MAVDIVFETHSIGEDNERGIATGWLRGRLSPAGRALAKALGDRRRGWAEAALTSDLARAFETADIAFAGSLVPILRDPRLRECNYGDRNGSRAAEPPRMAHVEVPFANGERYRQVVSRMASLLDDLRRGWEGRRAVLTGRAATRWALDHLLPGQDLTAAIAAPFAWREGWSYRCSP
jgi:2,3-bisphosphoglycerate-dependent phosphoglycerate mutase